MPYLTFKVEHTPEVQGLIVELIKHGLVIEGYKDPNEYLTIQQAAGEAGKKYQSFRKTVVEKGKITHSRPTGDGGDPRIRRGDLWAWLACSPQ